MQNINNEYKINNLVLFFVNNCYFVKFFDNIWLYQK
jgi:hypothetical protein